MRPPSPSAKQLALQLDVSQSNCCALALLVDLELLGKAGETSTKGGALHGVYAIGDCATISKRSMLEHMDAMWAAADTDKNGVLNHDELNTMLSLLAHDFPQVGDGRMPRRHTWRCPPPPSTRGAAPLPRPP